MAASCKTRLPVYREWFRMLSEDRRSWREWIECKTRRWRGGVMRGARMSDDDRAVPPLMGALVRLGVCFGLALIPALQPNKIPPGNVWSLGETVSSAAILAGAYWAGWRCFYPMLFLLYGLFGGLVVGLVFLPDARDYISISQGGKSPIGFAVAYCVCVVAFGLTCRAFGKTGSEDAEQSRRRRGRGVPKCEGCGYLLYGLAQRRCPECGRPFSSPPEPPPADSPTTEADD